MMENKYKLGDLFFPVAVAIKDAKDSPYDKFVGLEHYDSLEPVINRFTDTSLLSSSVKEFHTGDMLVARRNVYLKRAGLALFDGLTSGDSIVLRLKQESEIPEGLERDVLSRILPFVLNSENFWIYANKHADGMNSKRISIDNLLNYEFELPVIDEQKVLAEKLWAAYEVKQSYLKMIDATQEMVKSQYDEMFGNKEQNIKNGILGDFCSLKAGKSIKADNIINNNDESLYPCFGGNGLRGYVATFSHEGVYVIIGRQGALCGNVNIAHDRFYATEHAVVVTPKDNINTYWLFYTLKKMNLNQYARGVAQPGLAVSQLEKLFFGIPPLAKQNLFEAIYRQADKSISELRKSIDAIDKVIKSLINENL